MSKLLAPDSFAQYQERKLCLCALFSCSVTSGVRTIGHNAAVGGSPVSKHVLHMGGMADDLVPDKNTLELRGELVQAAHALGLWALDEVSHVHIQGRGIGP